MVVILLSMAINPHVAKSTTGSVAHAELLPVKIEHNEEGEIWRLPNGQNVFKVGGQAPPRPVENGIELSGDTLKSSMLDVELQSTKESEIVYKDENSTQVSKENWFIYEKDSRISWDSVTDENIFLKNIQVQEKVGDYLVNDYERVATKERTLSNMFGDLWIEYKLHEGRPLKHTLNFTASQGGTFKLCQEFSELDYDEIIKYDEDQLIDRTDKIDVDLAKSAIVEKKNSALPEIVEFRKDGKLVMGEITKGAKTDFQSFEYDADFNTAKFCYGDFTLKSGESFLVDPDTYTTNNPTTDFFIVDAGNNNVCDVAGTRDSTGTEIQIGTPDTAAGADCWRSGIEFPTTSITDGSDVTDVDIILDASHAEGGSFSCDFTPITNQLSVASDAVAFADIGDGTAYLSTTTCYNVGGLDNITFDLGTSADTDLENLLSSNWFGVGIRKTDETNTGTFFLVKFVSEEGTGTPDPTLSVTYTLAEVDTLVTVNHYTGNTTALTACSITQSNSSTSSTKTCNGSGMETFTGLTGNQNFTVKDTDRNLIINKTRNFTPSTNLIINATIVEVNCVQTGSATDARIILNQTDGHVMTNMTRPTCTTSNQQVPVISFNATFSPSGQHSRTFVSDLRVEIRNETAFGKNALKFLHNNVENTTSYSNGVITSSDFPIGSGTATSSTLRKFYIHLDPKPEAPISVSGTGASTSQINLSWTAPDSGVSSISGYKIYRGTDGTNFPTLVTADTGSSTTSYSDTGLLVGTTYYYKIAAINSYGTGANSTAGSGATQSAGGGGSSGGGGGGGGGVATQIPNTITLNLFPKTGTMFLGETKQFTVDFTWDIIKSSTLKIKSIVVGTSPVDSLKIVPEELPLDGKPVQDGKSQIKVILQAPPNQCNPTNPTAQCVNLKTYTVPLSILVQGSDGVNYGPYSAVLQVEIVKQQASGTIIIVLVMAAITAAIIQLARTKKPKTNTPKHHKSAVEKAIKNARKSPKSKHFLKKLFS